MKRIKSLLVSALLAIVSANVSAQADGTFQFIDKDGNTVADGSTCTFNAHYDEDWGMVIPHRPVSQEHDIRGSIRLGSGCDRKTSERYISILLSEYMPSQCSGKLHNGYRFDGSRRS